MNQVSHSGTITCALMEMIQDPGSKQTLAHNLTGKLALRVDKLAPMGFAVNCAHTLVCELVHFTHSYSRYSLTNKCQN